MSDDKEDKSISNIGRREFLVAAAGAAALVGATASTVGEAEAQSVAWKQSGNNKRVLALQTGGDAGGNGKVVFDYFGHSAFRITTPKGVTLAFDPWRNDPSGAWGIWFPKEFPRIVVDVGLSTHTHFDHDAIDRLDATVILDRLVGKWTFADVTIDGIADKHSTDQPGWYKWIDAVKEFGVDPYPPDNPGHLDNVTFLIETGGVRILAWGDNRHNPPEDVWERWGRVDVLTLPVDGSQHILSYQQATEIVDRLKPKIVIPIHYLASGTSSGLSTLQSAQEWVDLQKGKKRTVEGPQLVLDAQELASSDREIHYFGDQAFES
jgi:L-ascorbate metabolism protein UlaG (beta-lactamase superfamily)